MANRPPKSVKRTKPAKPAKRSKRSKPAKASPERPNNSASMKAVIELAVPCVLRAAIAHELSRVPPSNDFSPESFGALFIGGDPNDSVVGDSSIEVALVSFACPECGNSRLGIMVMINTVDAVDAKGCVTGEVGAVAELFTGALEGVLGAWNALRERLPAAAVNGMAFSCVSFQ